MRNWIYATALSLAAFGTLASVPANAMPLDRSAVPAISGDIEQVQFFLGGRNYCWYDNGWNGPGFYWCGYAFRRGFGWGGGHGWHGWSHGGGRVGVRPGGGQPHFGRPGGRPGGKPGGRPGGGRPGGKPGGGGGQHHH